MIIPRVGAFVVQESRYLGRVARFGNVSVDVIYRDVGFIRLLTRHFGIQSMHFYPDALSAIKAIMKGSQA